MLATVLLSVLSSAAPAPAALPVAQDPSIRITISNDRQFSRGDRAKVKIRTDDDGFLVVLHADADGRVRVLFPLDPGDDNFVRGRHTYELRDRGDRESFVVEADAGQGAIYAAVSRDPFRFDAYTLNHHWDYDALNAQDPGTDPEPVLGDIVQRMASGRYDYDYLTYDVYQYSTDVAYAPSVVYTPAYYYGWGCPSYGYFYYDCDPYYYSGSRFSVNIGFGYPWYSRPYYYDPYVPVGYYGYYYPYAYRPYRYDGYHYPVYSNPGVGGYPYRQRYYTPSEFKQANRTWGGVPYRDRQATADVRAVNTLYNPAPVRRGTTTGDMGRAPAAAPSGSASEPRRRVEATPARVERPRTESRPAERRGTSSPRVEARPARPADAQPARRRTDESRVQSGPELQRRKDAPNIERVAPRRTDVTVQRPAPRAARPEPRRVEAPRRVESPPQERRARQSRPAERPQPAARSAPRSYSPPSSYSAPARSSSPPPARSGGSGGGGGGRRGPR